MSMNISADPSAVFTALCERYWDFICFEQPISAILAGRSTVDDALFRESIKDHERRVVAAQAMRADLEKIPVESLQGQDRHTHRLMNHDLRMAVEA
jgi:hypothetical protein